jgi:hypothetical protein
MENDGQMSAGDLRESRPNFLEGIDPTMIDHDHVPQILTAILNQMAVVCGCMNRMESKQRETENYLLLFRVSKCGWDWIKDANNIKAVIALIGGFTVVDFTTRYLFWFVWPK